MTVAVIFTCQLSKRDMAGYSEMSRKLDEEVEKQAGYKGQEFARNEAGFGITVSYWDSMDAARAWKQQAEHRVAQKRGKDVWYDYYHVVVTTVEREYTNRASPSPAEATSAST